MQRETQELINMNADINVFWKWFKQTEKPETAEEFDSICKSVIPINYSASDFLKYLLAAGIQFIGEELDNKLLGR